MQLIVFRGLPDNAYPGGLTPGPGRLVHHRDTEDTEKGGKAVSGFWFWFLEQTGRATIY